jgi:predicted transcriptional regulator YheO
MNAKAKERMRTAAENAAEMIRGHAEVGLQPEDVNELDEKGLMEYNKACERVAKYLNKLAEKYK